MYGLNVLGVAGDAGGTATGHDTVLAGFENQIVTGRGREDGEGKSGDTSSDCRKGIEGDHCLDVEIEMRLEDGFSDTSVMFSNEELLIVCSLRWGYRRAFIDV